MDTTKIEHLLSLANAADGRAGEAAASEDKAEGGHSKRLLRCANKRKVAVAAEQVEIGVDVVIRGDRIEDEVETTSVLLHLVGVTGDDDFVGAEAQRIFLFAGRGGEDHDVGSERMGKLHAHVAQSAETDHTNFLAPRHAPAAQGRVGCDPGAEERRGPGWIEIGGYPQNEVFVDDDAVRISTIGNAPEVLVRGVEGEGLIRAELFKSILAVGAGPVRVDQAADRGEVPGLEPGDGGADLGDTTDDLVARHDRVDGRHESAPLVTDLMEIGVADAAEEDLDLYVVFVWIATLDIGEGKRRY